MAYTKQVYADFSPGANGTVPIPQFDDNVICIFIRPTTPILGTVTVTFPTGCQNGQAVRGFFTNTISIVSMTYSGSGGIVGGLSSAIVGKSFVAAYNAAMDAWVVG